ncbi:MAG TPA: sigma 54-interacting transcriptional regulator [Clostridiales bacterium]|nr:sigma 54-interacting transcriptional regulator [Clostridiales bacterium]HQP69138.1 sigma 54-interacting transcriptional regulator [Clostridiales bacterium]
MNKICIVFNSKENEDRFSLLKSNISSSKTGIELFDFYDSIYKSSKIINWDVYELVLIHKTDMEKYEEKFYESIENYKGHVVYFSGGEKSYKFEGKEHFINFQIFCINISNFLNHWKEKSQFDFTLLTKISLDSVEKKNAETDYLKHQKLKQNQYSQIIDFLKNRPEKILFADDDIGKEQKSSDRLTVGNSIESVIELTDKKQRFDIAVLDIEFAGSDKSGFDILKALKRYNSSVKVIMLSGHDGFDAAYKSFAMGADHFISKKNFNLAYFEGIIELIGMDGAPLIIGKSAAALDMFAKLSKYSKFRHNILILGPNGTGKELIAKSIYHLGKGKGKFVTKNCAGIPHELFEAEMFGYVKGAFTGAKDIGRESPFEEAENGVLFLDEIGDLPVYQQSKMLRVLQEKKIVRVGENIERDVSKTRLVFATNKDLAGQIKKEEFRQDLYYRITGAEIVSPALKDRKEDIELLTAYFVSKFIKDNNVEEDRKIKISEDSFKKLNEYEFPGNIRELEKIVYQAMLNFLANMKKKELEFIIPASNKTENAETLELKFYSLESIISLLKQKAITSRGLSNGLRIQIIEYLSGKGMNTKQIADELGINEQSLRNMRSGLEK